MSIKKLPLVSFAILMAISLSASSSVIVPDSSLANSAAKTEESRAEQLLQRLETIKDMNKSGLKRIEKKNLRKEVKDIKKEMKDKKGVFLSVGAIVIIILLLILIL
jgi:hypothetical protein